MLFISLVANAFLASILAAPPPLEFRETVVAGGGPGDFMEVRHLSLRGSSSDIGRKLAEFARERFGAKPAPSRDPLVVRAQRAFLAKNWPAQLERMRGVAAFHGGRLEDDAIDYGSLDFLLGSAPGCSVVHYPPGRTKAGTGVVSRNYDFTTGTIAGAAPGPGSPACTSRPIVLETRPDGGHATLAIVAYDLLGSAIDGINSEGLTVALLADDEIVERFPTEPTRGSAVGVGEIQVPRFLLETCANAEEAKAALLSTRQYYSFIPCHYLVADRHGNAFVFEWSAGRNVAHFIDGRGEALITTNFMRHLHPDAAALPREENPEGSFARYATLAACAAEGPLSIDEIKAANARVFARALTRGARPPARTLWHALYVPEKRSLEVDFYLGEGGTEAPDGGAIGRRSGYKTFTLAK